MRWRDWKIGVVKKGDERYPKSLLNTDNPPEQLFYRGNWSEEIFLKCLAVVGSRKMSEYGKRVVERLVPKLVEKGIVIVSGFMYGVDSEAHWQCLRGGGKTVAVLGNGLDILYPKNNGRLYDSILNKGGLVMSEYENDFGPKKWTFPERNRIVAGLSKAVLVIEGGERSGTLITARLAAEQGKTVMVVPNPIDSLVSRGANLLIREGAVPVRGMGDIMEEL